MWVLVEWVFSRSSDCAAGPRTNCVQQYATTFYTDVRDDARDEARESCSLTTLPAALAAELPLVGGPAATLRT